MTATQFETIDLYDPDLYVPCPPHELFAHLRRTQPVYRQEMPDGTSYWAILKHADVVQVARDATTFSAEEGGVVLEDLDAENLVHMRKMLLAMDPPGHVEYRRPLAPNFRAKVMAGLEGRIRTLCREIMVEASERGEVDFVHDVCGALPSQIVGELMGLPKEDLAQIQIWAEQSTSGQDPEINPDPDDYSPSRGAGSGMAMYGMTFAARRRREAPREDLTTVILSSEFDGHPMSDLDFGSFFTQLVTAGNDTTKTMLSAGLLSLLEHPDQMELVRGNPSLIPGAIEEILRHDNPLHYFRRTAKSDSEVRGVKIRAGEKLAMMYTSANRDEDVFIDPHRFDVRRDPNPHLSFGIGEHFCLGAHLARLEGRVFFEELLATFSKIELTGAPRRVRSNLNNGLKQLPVRLGR